MTVRAKFVVQSITRHLGSQRKRNEDGSLAKDGNARDIYVQGEMQTVKLSPVYGNGDPEHENTKFWEASPSGSIELGTVNAVAAAEFDIGAEFYIDFTRAVK